MISDYVRFIRFKKDLACDAFTVGLTVQRDIVVRGGTGWADATMQSLRQIILGPEASGAKRFRQSLSFQDPSSSAFRLVVEASRTKVGLSFGWKHCNPLETPTNNVSCACTCGCTRIAIWWHLNQDSRAPCQHVLSVNRCMNLFARARAKRRYKCDKCGSFMLLQSVFKRNC